VFVDHRQKESEVEAGKKKDVALRFCIPASTLSIILKKRYNTIFNAISKLYSTMDQIVANNLSKKKKPITLICKI